MLEHIKRLDRLSRIFKGLPTTVGGVAVTFFKERFQQQNWVDNRTEPWKKRKKKKKENEGRAILTQTGRLKRSIRVTRKGPDFVAVGTDVVYAQIHNEGGKITATATVKAHKRKKTGKKGKRGKKKEPVITIDVASHTRKMNTRMPRRQFMGNSAVLTKRIERTVTHQILKAIK